MQQKKIFPLDNTCGITTYADGNTPYTSNVSENLVINKLQNSYSDRFKLFRENHLKGNLK